MKLYTLPRRAAAALLAAAVFCTATLSVFASDSAPASSAADSAPSGSGASSQAAPPEDASADLEEDNGAAPAAKEEVIYGKLAADGTVESLYAVNRFEATAGVPITDYGHYTAVRNMTTTDPITSSDGAVTLTPAADGTVYYEGTMARLPKAG